MTSSATLKQLMNKRTKLNKAKRMHQKAIQKILLNDYRHQRRKKLKDHVDLEHYVYCPRTKQWHDKAINKNEITVPKTI